MRDPSADLAERLASGAGDLATGVASMLRALGRGGHGTSHDDGDIGREGDEFWESLRRRAAEQAQGWARPSGYGSGRPTDVDNDKSDVDSDPWRAATTATGAAAPRPPMAKKAVAKKAVAKKAVAKKAVAKKTVASTVTPPAAPPAMTAPTPPGGTSAPPANKAAKKAVPKKTTAKKTAKKAVPPPEEFG
jgi:hypothetical protein